MKTKLTILVNSLAFMLIGAGVNAYAAQSYYGMDRDQSMNESSYAPTMGSNPSSMPMRGDVQDIDKDITNLNNEIMQVSQNFDENYDKAMKSAQNSSDSRAIQGSFMDRVDALKNRFNTVLNDYKPADQNWTSFNAAETHNVNMKDRNDKIRFADYADRKLTQLEGINKQLVDLKWEMEGKDYRRSYYNTYPSTYYTYPSYGYYDYYPSAYYGFPFSFGLNL